MNDLTSMKQRFISALDKSDTPKEFLLNTFEEIYKLTEAIAELSRFYGRYKK